MAAGGEGKKPLKNVKWLEKTREHEAIKDRSIKDVANNSSRRSEGKEGKKDSSKIQQDFFRISLVIGGCEWGV